MTDARSILEGIKKTVGRAAAERTGKVTWEAIPDGLNRVSLPLDNSIESAWAAVERPYQWCVEQHRSSGLQWSRRVDRRNGLVHYKFSDQTRAVYFKLLFH